LNNIGLFIGNVTDLLELPELDKERMKRDLSRAMEQVRKGSAIISHLRTFGRAAPASRERVPVKDVLDRSLSLLHEQLRLREIHVEVDLAGRNPVVVANAIQLEQVFLNLLTNARDAVADSPTKTIWIRGRVQGETLKLVFEDSGPGIPPGVEQRVFDPFFTTKEVGAGTGLGLSITYGIIRDHGGSITVSNRPGEGAAFEIELPAARGVDLPEAKT